MSIDQANQIDAIGVDKGTGCVILTISDHLPWPDTPNHHLRLLREKLNSYLAFIEGGELLESYPDASGKHVVISVVAKHDLSPEGEAFLSNAARTIADAGMTLEFKKLVHGPTNSPAAL